ncbi:hypothetical protein HanRHA438_Chr07g0307411 [Helianthus annuus]|nr:hypothetical protein HanRHA438_Chr07g0307411 [Helianthus annuus]
MKTTCLTTLYLTFITYFIVYFLLGHRVWLNATPPAQHLWRPGAPTTIPSLLRGGRYRPSAMVLTPVKGERRWGPLLSTNQISSLFIYLFFLYFV